MNRDIIAQTIVNIVNSDIYQNLRETKGKNRSPRIDSFNQRVSTSIGNPYCASALWCAADDACRALGLKNPIKPTASSQDFRRSSFVPQHYIKRELIGKKGDFGVLQMANDSSKGHLVCVVEDQTDPLIYKAGEYNTDGSGTRDGDGAYHKTRNTIDKSKENAGKLFICFVDIPQWILDANSKV